MKNYIGLVNKKLIVLDQKRENNRTYLFGLCKNCNKKKWIRADYFKNCNSCGCITKFKTKDYKGIVKNGIEFLEPTEKKENGHILWICKCICGNLFIANPSRILKGDLKSCGCKKIKYTPANIEKAFTKHLTENIVEGTNLQVLKYNKLKRNNTSGYIGVTWDKVRKKWRAQIRFKNKNIYLGRYTNIEDAIKARKEAEEKYFKPILERYNKE